MSRNANNNIFRHVDWVTVGLFALLCIFGWMNVYGASYSFDQTSAFSFAYRSGKQLVWILTAFLMGGFILLLDTKVFDVASYVLYPVLILLLLATPFLAHDIKGSLSWITIGPVSLQPAEFAKCITALALAKYMGSYDFRIRTWRDLIIPFIILFLPMAIIAVWQKETGSALVFGSFLLMFYREGMTGSVLLLGVLLVVLFVLTLKTSIITAVITVIVVGLLTEGWLFYHHLRDKRRWRISHMIWTLVIVLFSSLFCTVCNYAFEKILQPHQRARIEVLLGLKEDPKGVGYNVTQSLNAIGSGGFFGKGFLNGTMTKMNFVPEQATDFIFCTVGEEWGFVGSSLLLIVYALLILRLIFLAERQREMFAQIYAYCVVGIFLFHLSINIGMVLGLLPVIGIPLPFISYGGSSMWGFTILLFILLRLDAARVDKM